MLVEKPEVRLYRLPNMKLVRKYKLKNLSYVNAAYLLSKSLFIIGKEPLTMKVEEDTMWRTSVSSSVLLSLKTGCEKHVDYYPNSFVTVRVSPDGKYLSTCSMEHEYKIYEVVCRKGKCSLKELNLDLPSLILDGFFPRKGVMLVKVYAEGHQYLEVKLDGKEPRVLKVFETPLSILDAWGNWALLSSEFSISHEPAKLMNLKTGKTYDLPYKEELLPLSTSAPYCVLVNDGSALLCVFAEDEKRYLKIWNISDPKRPYGMWEDENRIYEVRLSPDRRVILLADYTNKELKVIRVYNSGVKVLYRVPFSKVIKAIEGKRKLRRKSK
ncbi:MAG: WD40 repeat domain-containing protein [Thermotogae bacterium]|nr:WD40 repeat domain-containing protein [Thermotogota bacterium]